MVNETMKANAHYLEEGDLKKLLLFLAAVFAGSSLVSWGCIMWDDEALTRAKKIGKVVISGVVGSIVACLLWEHMQGDRVQLAGISVLAGAGGPQILKLMLSALIAASSKLLPPPKKDEEE